jgi:haloacetate dehalogenase
MAGFTPRRIRTAGPEIHLRIGGKGPPVLLLHGYPQTHLMWHRVAPVLAERFTVVCPDLRGYGDSGRPETDPEHLSYSKRAMAADMVEVMTTLGFTQFDLVGHDRGGRVAHRLCLDHPARVGRAALLDIVPTRTLFVRTDMALAVGYYHWFFLSQPAPLPERLIGGDPLFYLHRKLAQWSAGQETSVFAPEAIREYERCFADPAVIHATCEDYRAGATIDLVHDERDLASRIACPLLVLWGRHGLMHRHFDVLATWREKAVAVQGEPLDCGHFLPEEQPAETALRLLAFLGG